ncbi:MAG: hypothetical protein R3C53_17105 [Pirellulaceae bacterium]
MPLVELDLEIDDQAINPQVAVWLSAARRRIESYWDNFKSKPLPQYIECDFDYVAAGLEYCVQRDLIDGKLFVEWGCGFGVVTGIAALLGLDAVGIEAEEFLCEEARILLAQHGVAAEIWQGNFLPNGARRLAEDEDPLVSLTHYIPPAYDEHDMPLEDFAIVFAYPWPGEEHFLRAVFSRYARRDALMLMFRGPYQIELYRKR